MFDLFRLAGTADVIVLSELSNQYAVLGWIAARIGHSVYVVDGFVGLYETRVLDWQKYSVNSLRARVLRLLDKIAVVLSSYYLVDTNVRAEQIFDSGACRTSVIALPVGAPDWAVPDDSPGTLSARQVRLLQYGNYAPLHGVDTVIDALAQVRSAGIDAHLVLVGDGPLRGVMEERLRSCGLLRYCTLIDRVAETSLPSLIHASDITLGIFGVSTKASSVIANKVWQGLAAGRPVITRTSPALAEIREIAGAQLIEVPAQNPRALAEAIIQACRSGMPRAYQGTAAALRDYVDLAFDSFLERLKSSVSARTHIGYADYDG
ncbi:glycosyltransferase [Microbacterium horticulturae]|uniref:Glycosyltransferase n=1 Tax=Microbacterium horticulturae TaxID=3028316 RepID=A0ABY8C0H8_9MICO|nr:glycosyltransferase [Microbacterium sp. KACC 23027]WEG08163.1 glycosyltransferase [Microbacterium sp. KACC 23027]